jgi:hypothetical protein
MSPERRLPRREAVAPVHFEVPDAAFVAYHSVITLRRCAKEMA